VLLATWYSHAMAASTVTTLMGVDSSRFTSAVTATTFFGVVGLASIMVAGASLVLLFIGMFLTMFFPPPSKRKKGKFWVALWVAFKENGPRVLPLIFFMVMFVAVVPEAILGGSNFTRALAARIAFTYDLADPEMCGSTNPHERFLPLLDSPSRAIRYRAADLPKIPVTFLNKLQIKTIMPIEQSVSSCQRSRQ
jgi:hypothetical protein